MENALATAGHSKSHNKGDKSSTQKPDHTDAECWKCGRNGHINKNCHMKGKKKDDSKGKESANATTGSKEFSFTMPFTGATLACNTSPLSNLEVDVYDSGTSSHMSPNRACFISMKEIPPKPIKAADQTLFTATAIGDLHVSIPNGKTSRDITLKQVLYCLDLAFTLVSLTRCDLAGYSALLKGCKYTISDPHRTILGQIPLSGGLYKHKYALKATETANATQVLSINDLH